MAVNAKIGLLLGLVFVFVLAFALNSVHRSGDREGSSDLAPLVVEGPSGIKPEMPLEALPPEPVAQGPAIQTPAAGTKDRYRTLLPEVAAPDKSSNDIEPAKPASAPVRYIVCEGDSLAYIARKFYGPQQGNKRENVLRIFEANRGLLKSPDQIDVGQELVIPPLETSQPQKNSEPTIFPDTMFEKVESIGRKPL
jgi:nucleoid-associated protein YgaU